MALLCMSEHELHFLVKEETVTLSDWSVVTYRNEYSGCLWSNVQTICSLTPLQTGFTMLNSTSSTIKCLTRAIFTTRSRGPRRLVIHSSVTVGVRT